MQLTVIVNSDLDMSKGKIASQCCHASLASYKSSKQSYIRSWKIENEPVIILKAKEDVLYSLIDRYSVCAIYDQGKTEVPKDSLTCISFKICDKLDLPKEIRDLKLL